MLAQLSRIQAVERTADFAAEDPARRSRNVESRKVEGRKQAPDCPSIEVADPKDTPTTAGKTVAIFTARPVSSTNVWSLICAHLRHLRIFITMRRFIEPQMSQMHADSADFF
jgi:hypothetical protein